MCVTLTVAYIPEITFSDFIAGGGSVFHKHNYLVV